MDIKKIIENVNKVKVAASFASGLSCGNASYVCASDMLDDFDDKVKAMGGVIIGALSQLWLHREAKKISSMTDKEFISYMKSKQKALHSRVVYQHKIYLERLKRIKMYKKPSSKKAYKVKNYSLENIFIIPLNGVL